MSPNVGGIDKVLRIVIGVVLIALAATGSIGAWGYRDFAVVDRSVWPLRPVFAVGHQYLPDE